MSIEAAVTKAEGEYEHFAAQRSAQPSAVERHFDEAAKAVAQLAKARPRAPREKKR